MKNKISVLLKFFKYILVFDSWFFLKKAEVFLVAHDHDRAFKYKGLHYSTLVDSLAELLIDAKITREYFSKPYSAVGSGKNYFNYRTANHLFICMDILAFFVATIQRRKVFEVRMRLRHYIWIFLLKKVSPRLVVGVQPDNALCSAARSLNIEVYDLQHGVISETIPAYGEKYISMTPTEWLPTGYLCWDKYSADIINVWAAKKGIRTFVVGNPWVSRFSYPEKTDHLVQEFSSVQSLSFRSEKKILVALQWDLARFYPEYFAKDQFIHSEFLEMFTVLKDVQWLVRMHPVQKMDPIQNKKITEILSQYENVEFAWSSEAPLPSVLAQVDAHITWDSCVVIEAASMGVKSFVANPGGFAMAGGSVFEQIKEIIEIPYLEYEKLGYVDRSREKVRSQDMVQWIQKQKAGSKMDRVKRFDLNIITKSVVQ